jgi:hypothetical protein
VDKIVSLEAFGNSAKPKRASEKTAERERTRVFAEVLGEAGKSTGCCESCNYRVKKRSEYQPYELGHNDSGLLKESCADYSEPRYHPKPAKAD